MSKAAELIAKQLKESLTRKVGRLLKGFENRYMAAYLNWNVSIIEEKAARYKGLNTKEEFDVLVGMRHEECVIKNSCRYDKSGVVSPNDAYHAYMIKSTNQRKLDLGALLSYEYLSEAAEGYKTKFTNLIEKLAKHEMDIYQVNVEKVKSSGSELEFLISDDSIEVHARAIWVEGAIKAPHYRFITTKRNK